MRKGISEAMTVVLLVLITIAVVGLAYVFFSGFFGTATGKAVFVSGSSSCVAGEARIVVVNGGTADIPVSEVSIVRTSCNGPTTCPADTLVSQPTSPILAGSSGTFSSLCAQNNYCTFDVTVGGATYPTRANC